MRSITARTTIAILFSLGAASTAGVADLGYRGVGPRVGISSDPDQVVGGVHVDFGEFARGVRFQLSVEAGFGDDTTTIQGNFMVAYYFPVQAAVTPYAGGSFSAAFFDFDDCRGFGARFGRCDDSETEIGPVGVGGIETKLSGGARFLAELQLGFADLPEVKLVAGWTF
jgi:hypothetical protein